MKKLLLFASLIFAIETSFAQIASDYYMPMCVGNQTVLHADGNGYGWTGRTLTYTNIKTDSINGILYYVQEGKEYLFNGNSAPSVFNYSWLRADVNGNVLIKAISFSEPILDSALIFASDMIIMSNNFFTPGYSLTQTVFPGVTLTDSVISTNAAWEFFSNCIQVRETDIEDGDTTGIEDIYYANGIGRVGGIRIFPDSSAHTKEFGTTFFTGCDPIVDSIPSNVIDTCLGQYFDYYVNNILIDTINHTLTVTWVFQDSAITKQFVQTYSYQYPGNNVIGITIQCNGKKTSETFYKTVNINSSSMLDVAENGASGSVFLFPNPAKNEVTVVIPNTQGGWLNIYSMMGALVKTQLLMQNQQQIDIGNLSNGVYIIEIKTGSYSEKQKLIIQK